MVTVAIVIIECKSLVTLAAQISRMSHNYARDLFTILLTK